MFILRILGFPGGTSGKEPTCQCWRHKRHGFDPCLGKILVWRILWAEEPGRLEFTESRRVGHV